MKNKGGTSDGRNTHKGQGQGISRELDIYMEIDKKNRKLRNKKAVRDKVHNTNAIFFSRVHATLHPVGQSVGWSVTL